MMFLKSLKFCVQIDFYPHYWVPVGVSYNQVSYNQVPVRSDKPRFFIKETSFRFGFLIADDVALIHS